jgi:hypothetical protein
MTHRNKGQKNEKQGKEKGQKEDKHDEVKEKCPGKRIYL